MTKKTIKKEGSIRVTNELYEYLDDKMEKENSGSNWFWLKGIYIVEWYLDNDGNLDEITMQGEFNEEIDIVKEWIREWKDGK